MSKVSKGQWILVRKVEGALVPHAHHDEVMFERIPENKAVYAQFKQPRSLPRHRLYWVTLRIVVENTDKFATEEALHKSLLVGCGVVEPIITPQGEILFCPSSTAFDAMPEDEFKAYFDQAMELITTLIIPDLDLDDLLREARDQSRFNEAA